MKQYDRLISYTNDVGLWLDMDAVDRGALLTMRHKLDGNLFVVELNIKEEIINTN